MKIRTAIIDDHPLLIKGLQGMLEQNSDIEIVGTFQNGRDLLIGLRSINPDILLLDIQLQGQSGDELLPIIQKEYPHLIVLALTNMEHEYYIKTMLQHGLKGYVLKSSSEVILLEAIRSVAKGQQYFDPTIRKAATKAQNSITNTVTLTKREKEVLQLLTEDLTSQEIADRLFVNKKTIEAHRLHLLQKLGVKTSASLIKKAIDLGLIR